MDRRTEVTLTLIAILIALFALVVGCVTLLFGDNFYQQIRGRSVFADTPSSPPTSVPAVTQRPVDLPSATAPATPSPLVTSPAASPAAVSTSTPLPATPMPSSTTADLSTTLVGRWEGEWTDPAGFSFSCVIIIETMESNSIKGYILWTLERSPRESDQSKLGSTAIEYIHGNYKPDIQSVTFSGYDLDDSYGIIEMDEYRLILSEDAMTLSGETKDHGTWQGKLTAARKP